MRLNQFLAAGTALSRRSADEAIRQGLVTVDGQPAVLGQTVNEASEVRYRGRPVTARPPATIAFHKPIGTICSRTRQGNTPTIYEVLPPEFSNLRSVGRLDRDTSGLLILTSDGQLQQRLSHPSYGKLKTYRVTLDRPLTALDAERLGNGVALADGPSRLAVRSQTGHVVTVALGEGRNRQIRRTFAAIGYRVTALERTAIAELKLGSLPVGQWRTLEPGEKL